MVYRPHYKATASMVKYLGKIEAAREVVEQVVLPVNVEREFSSG